MFSKMSRLVSGTNQLAIQWVVGALSWEESGQSMRLPTHLHKVIRLRKSGATPSWHVQGQLHIVFYFYLWNTEHNVYDNTGKQLLHNQSGVSTACQLQQFPLLLYQKIIAVEQWLSGHTKSDAVWIKCNQKLKYYIKNLSWKLKNSSSTQLWLKVWQTSWCKTWIISTCTHI